VVYLVVLQGMGFVWGVIPGMHSIQIFGNTSTVNGVLKEYNVQSILFSSNVFPMYQNAGPGGSGTSYD
jgi:TctA family transporter